MNKTISAFATAAFVIISSFSFAQNAHEARVKFMKGDQNAIIADYDLPKGLVEDALKERLEKAGLTKKSSEKGFTTYKGTNWLDVSPDKMDVYVKVEGKGDKSMITVLVSKGYDNFITSTTDVEKVQRVQTFLNGFINDAKAYQLRLSVIAQEKVIKEVEKDLKNSSEDGEKLNRDKEKVERQIAENKSEQTKKQTVVDSEKKKLEDLKAQLQ